MVKRVLHMVRVCGIVATEGAQERKNVLSDHGVHVGRGEVLEARPAQILVGAAPVLADAIVALRENPTLHWFLEPSGLVLLQRVKIV
jgi:hypothetical protein